MKLSSTANRTGTRSETEDKGSKQKVGSQAKASIHLDHKQVLREKQEKRKIDLNESMKKIERNPEFESILKAKEKIFDSQKERARVSELIDEIRKSYQKVKDDVKALQKEQINTANAIKHNAANNNPSSKSSSKPKSKSVFSKRDG